MQTYPNLKCFQLYEPHSGRMKWFCVKAVKRTWKSSVNIITSVGNANHIIFNVMSNWDYILCGRLNGTYLDFSCYSYWCDVIVSDTRTQRHLCSSHTAMHSVPFHSRSVPGSASAKFRGTDGAEFWKHLFGIETGLRRTVEGM